MFILNDTDTRASSLKFVMVGCALHTIRGAENYKA